MRLLAFLNCGFESGRGHGCLSVVSVVCCQLEVSATSWSLVQRSPTDCVASLCVIEKPREWGGHGPRWAAAPKEIYIYIYIYIYFYSKTNQMHNISNLFYFGTALYMFRMVCLSIIRSLNRTYSIRCISFRFCDWLLACSHRTCMVWRCMYSLRFLMMDGETVRNM